MGQNYDSEDWAWLFGPSDRAVSIVSWAVIALAVLAAAGLAVLVAISLR